jgi:acyl-CoA thioesterase
MDIDVNQFRKFFAADKFAASAGVRIDSVTPDRVICSMDITSEHLNAGGGVQGGAIFTLADLAFAVHCNMALVCGEDVGLTVGQSCSISFLRATKGKKLIAASSCLSRGKNISVYRITVEDDLGFPIAEFTGNAFTLGRQKNADG